MSASGDSYGLFWQSSNGDRTYNADSLERWLKHFFKSGVFTGELQVLSSSGMTVNVETGYANVDGKVMMFASETQITLDPPNSRYPRIDNIVVERNDTDRQITLKKVTGEYSGPDPEPTPPVRENGVYQLVLAHIYVGAGASSIVQANITDTRSDPDICGIVTGTVTEMDFSQFAAQFNDYIEQFEITYEADFEAWSDAQMAAFTLWMTNTQADFDAWYAAIQASLHNLPPASAEYLQVEINDLQEEIEGIQSSSVRSWNGRSGSVMPMAGDYNASMNGYDNTVSELDAENEQEAIDELTDISKVRSVTVQLTANSTSTAKTVAGLDASWKAVHVYVANPAYITSSTITVATTNDASNNLVITATCTTSTSVSIDFVRAQTADLTVS